MDLRHECNHIKHPPCLRSAARHIQYSFYDPKLPLKSRIDNLLSLLTLEEKPTLLIARNSPRGNVSRLGVPEYDWGGNCIHGVQSRCATNLWLGLGLGLGLGLEP